MSKPVVIPLPAGVLSIVPVWIDVLLSSIKPTIGRLIEYTEEMWRKFVNAIPNPLAMWDVFARWTSGCVGILVIWPFTGFEAVFLAFFEEHGLGRKVMRVDEAIKGFFACQKEFFLQVSTLGEEGLFERFLKAIARGLWRFISKIKFLLKIIKVETVEDFVLLFVKSWRKKIRFYGIVGLVWIMALTALWVTFLLSASAIALYIQTFWNHTLPQDSKRKYVSNYRQHRVNRVKGPDFPPKEEASAKAALTG